MLNVVDIVSLLKETNRLRKSREKSLKNTYVEVKKKGNL